MPGYISGYDKNIYHLLCRAFSQGVSITEVVNFDIFYVVSVRNIHISIDITCARSRNAGRGDFAHRACRLILSVMSIRERTRVSGYSLHVLVGHLHAVYLSWLVLKHLFGLPPPLHEVISTFSQIKNILSLVYQLLQLDRAQSLFSLPED